MERRKDPHTPIPCFICGEKIDSDSCAAEGENHPSGGTTFTTHGHYGSTVFDPMDGSFLEINICDPCIDKRKDRALLGKSYRLIVTNEAWDPTRPDHLVPTVTGREEIPYKEQPPLKIWNGRHSYGNEEK